jgi:hypothetical protein
MQQLLGTGNTVPEDDATNPLIAHGLKWTLEECISMDVCRDQPKNTIINFPNGVVPDFGNFYSIWKLLFPYDICPIVFRTHPSCWRREGCHQQPQLKWRSGLA